MECIGRVAELQNEWHFVDFSRKIAAYAPIFSIFLKILLQDKALDI